MLHVFEKNVLEIENLSTCKPLSAVWLFAVFQLNKPSFYVCLWKHMKNMHACVVFGMYCQVGEWKQLNSKVNKDMVVL